MQAACCPDEIVNEVEEEVPKIIETPVTGEDKADDIVEKLYTLAIGIVDKNGNPLSGILVELSNGLQVISDEFGKVKFENLTKGDYSFLFNFGGEVFGENIVLNDDDSNFYEVTVKLDKGNNSQLAFILIVSVFVNLLLLFLLLKKKKKGSKEVVEISDNNTTTSSF